mmetsp:Transcript_125315/g.217226  ORF Transcript_125315/g.217226 Transcript_125315/m.217226 type:complete len:221 (+) Transcript_125315:1882-2544(+)
MFHMNVARVRLTMLMKIGKVRRCYFWVWVARQSVPITGAELGTARISLQGLAHDFTVLKRIRIVRLEAEGLVKVTGCPVQILQALHLGHSSVDPGLHVGYILLQDLVQVRQCPCAVVQLQAQEAPVGDGVGVLGVDLEGQVVVRHAPQRVRKELHFEVCPIHNALDLVGREFRGPVVVLQRGLVVRLPGPQDRPVEVGQMLARVHLEDGVDVGQGPLQVP